MQGYFGPVITVCRGGSIASPRKKATAEREPIMASCFQLLMSKSLNAAQCPGTDFCCRITDEGFSPMGETVGAQLSGLKKCFSHLQDKDHISMLGIQDPVSKFTCDLYSKSLPIFLSCSLPTQTLHSHQEMSAFYPRFSEPAPGPLSKLPSTSSLPS